MSQTLRSQTWIYLHKGPLIRIPLKIYSHFLIELPINPTFPACQIPSHWQITWVHATSISVVLTSLPINNWNLSDQINLVST